MITDHVLGFRINFVLGIGLNILTFATIWFWYHPVRFSLPYTIAILIHLSRTHHTLET